MSEEQSEVQGVSRTVPSLEVHRVAAHLQFHDHDLQPYWGLVSCFEPDHEDRHDGFEFQGEHWDVVGSNYWQGQIADPQGRDRFSDGLNEYQYRLALDDEVGDRDATIKLRPGYPEAKHVETGDLINGIPTKLPESLRLQVETTNVDVEEILPLIRAFFRAIGLNDDYARNPHDWSTIYEFEGYLRVDRQSAKAHLTGDGGMLQSLAQFGSSNGNKGEHKWDHEDVQGHYEATALDPDTWNMLLPNQDLAKRCKVYHPQHVRNEDTEDDPLAHPKLELQLWPDGQNESVSWEQSQHVLDEFQLTAANVLQWSGVGLDADSEHFVEDAYHDAGWSDEEVQIVDNPIPELEDEIATRAEDQLINPDVTNSEFDVIEVIADGGTKQYQDVATEADVSSSTIYRLAQKLGIVETTNGEVHFVDQVTRRRVESVVQRFRDTASELQQGLRDAASGLGRIRGDSDEPSALERWMDAHGAVLSGNSRDLHFEFPGRAFSEREIVEVLRSGFEAAVQSGLESDYRDALVSYRDRKHGSRSRFEIVKTRWGRPHIFGTDLIGAKTP